MIEAHATTRGQRARHRIGIDRLDADDFRLRTHALHVRRDPGDRSAAAHRDIDRLDRLRMLAADLDADRPLSGDDVRIVVRMDEGEAARLAQRVRMLVRVGKRVAVQQHVAAPPLHRVDLDPRCRHRHHDNCAAAELGRRQRDALRVIARRRRDHALFELLARQMRHLVVRAADLVREHRLLVLALQQHAVLQSRRQPGGQIKRRLDGDVVDARIENLPQVVDRHRARARRLGRQATASAARGVGTGGGAIRFHTAFPPLSRSSAITYAA